MVQIIWCFFAFILLQTSPLQNVEKITATTVKGSQTISATLNGLVGETAAKAYKDVMGANEDIEWQIHVPTNYNPARPAGVLVFISANESGKIPRGWKPLLDTHNLIWVGANKSGNKINPQRRMTYALMALAAVEKRYKIDSSRAYLSGFSGGGRVASLLAVQYPRLFKGAIYNSGANIWNENSSPALEQVKENRYVFITGRNDFNLEDTQRVYRAYKKAGINQAKLMVIPSMGHRNPNKKNYERAIMYLDQQPQE